MTKNPVYHFFYSPGNVGPLILRLSLSGIFFYHGTQKALGWFGGPGWQGAVEALAGFGLPAVVTSLVIAMEIAISLSLFFGFLTRLAGIAAAIVMSGALIVLSGQGAAFADLELPGIILAAGLAIACLGGGALSIDRAISRNLLPLVG